jgi:uncharacterized protein (TIGR00106 family)
MALMEISVIPLGLGSPSVGDHIAELIKYLQKEDVPHYLTDMGTVVQGEVPALLKLAQALHELPFTRGVLRVVTHISIDDRRDKKVNLGDKTQAVKARLT